VNPPRALALGIFGAALILIVSACGLLTRPTPGMARLVYFGPGNVSPGDNYAALRDDLRRAGWLEGQNFTFDWRVQADTTGIEAWMPELEAEIAQGRPVVVTTDSTAHALALKKATGRVSIVVGIGDPLASGVVTNDAHPGANITGVATSRYPQPSKKIEVLKEALPTVTHLGVLYAESTNPNLAPSLAEFEIATRQLGLEMASVQARRREDFEFAAPWW